MAEGTELAKYYVQIVPSAQGISGGIKSALGGDAAADEAGASFGSKLVSGIKTVIGAAAIGKFLKDTISAGANLEQSFGGLDTLYGDASETMKQFAADAAASGISMNNYAEQAVTMGAALKNALGGDATAAADKANIAILDMADNAAKMGTDLTSLQNAYTGFSRGNYTMLDNLSLGFAGTKEGMQSLLDKAQEISGIEYNIDSYADIVDAIHVVQEEMGIAGVASEEAATTISGSLGAMKASWENFRAVLTTGGDISGAMSTLVQNASNFLFGNLIPAVINIATSLPGAIVTGIREGLPLLIDGAMEMINGLVGFISEDLPEIFTEGTNIVMELVNGILENMPAILDTAINIVMNLVNGLVNNLPQIAQTALTLITTLITSILTNLPQILQTGITLIGKLAAGLIQAIPTLVGMLPQIVSSIVNFFTTTDWRSIGTNIIKGIANGLKSAGNQLWEAVKGILGNFKEKVLAFFGIHSPSRWGMYVGEMIDAGFAGGITGNASMVQNAVDELQTTATRPITTMLSTQASIASSISAADTSQMNQMINLLNVIANKDTKIVLNERELNRSLRSMGVAYA